MPFKLLEETSIAEVAYRVEAESIEGLFADSALAVSDSMVDLSSLSAVEQRSVELSAESIELLLYKFLNRIVFFKDSESILFKKYSPKIKDLELECYMAGEKIDSRKHLLKNDAKAVSLYLLKIEKEKGRYVTTIVIDV